MPCRPNCNETFASWMGAKMVLSPNTPLASAARSSRMAEYLRNVVVIPCCSSKTAGRFTKNCFTSTDFENPASRETSRRLLNSTEVFWFIECGPFLDTLPNKSLVSCLVALTKSCEMLRPAFGETFSPSLLSPDTRSELLCEYWDHWLTWWFSSTSPQNWGLRRSESNRFLPFVWARLLTMEKEHLNTECLLFANYFIIFAVGSHSPSGLSVNVPYHLFSYPRTDECLGWMFRACWATRVALSQHSFWLFLSNTRCHCTWTWKWSCLETERVVFPFHPS